ncbi:heme ABC exporter ATP-binding protein CcmA [Rhizobium sp. YIM 134829]|uniref:heme ABC exporter ATP-binding protein CcmA n=1 Tax=Rhizobium sp. YIM 134829 TaxID=3390453 RepID=UPI00397CF8F5
MTVRLLVEGLSARRGEALIFRDLDLSVASGEALLVTGRNGTGKSTLLRVLAGLLPAEAGQIRLEGVRDPDARIGESCHYLGHRNAMKRDLTVVENLIFWAAFTGSRDPSSTVGTALEAVGLDAIAHLPFGYLSAGQQRRIAIARLLVAPRPIWLLDEPTAALDRASERMVEALIASHRATGGLVIAATHQPLDVPGAETLEMQGFVVEEEA